MIGVAANQRKRGSRIIKVNELNDIGEHIEPMRSLMEGIVLALVDSKSGTPKRPSASSARH